MRLGIDQLLTTFIQNLSNPYGLERSVSLRPHQISAGRALYTVHKQHLGFRAKRKLLELADSLQIPADFASALDDQFDDANIIHLGVDADASHTCKIYLEFPLAQVPSGAGLLFRAFKWSPQANHHQAITDYTIDGRYCANEFGQSLDRYYPGTDLVDQKMLIERFLQIVHSAAPTLELLALTVTEHGNDRHSFDLNLYDANLTLANFTDWLVTAARIFELPKDEYQAAFTQVQNQSLGHIAGGVDRQSEAFVTLYHGLQGY